MKAQFSSLDVRVIAHELSNSLVTLRLANIYDLSTRIFLLKFAKPNHREQLLVDSGFRCHLTSFARATAAAPSAFVAKLRKFLRTRRVTKIEQVGTDRVIVIHFSDGLYRLFLEFYAGGNVVLTDADLTILALLRNVDEGAEHEQYRLGLKYDLTLRQNFGGVPPLTKERVSGGLRKALQRQHEEAQKPGKRVKKKRGDELRKALAVTTTEFPPVLIDHALEVSGYDRRTQPEAVIANEELMDKLLLSLEVAQKIAMDITSENTVKGYILAKQGPTLQQADDNNDTRDNLMYDDFHPFKPAHLAQDPSIVFIEIEGFNQTVDEFFSSLEGQKLESRLQEREENARKRIDAARQEQTKRIDGLQQVQQLNVRKAQAIEANIERVEEAIAAVNGLVAQGMDWVDIGRLIESEQARNNAVAEMIKTPLKLHENLITLLLSEYDGLEEEFVDETDSEGSETDDERHAATKPGKAADHRLEVDINLALSAYSNAREYYVQRRSAAEKQEKTARASEKALKSTEQKVMADLKKGLRQEKEVLRPIRKQMWFEKFIYFISSDGYLVLAGRDAQQNEILYRRYLRRGDVYVHADLHGAASVIIKNNPKTPEAPIPPSTISQAGNLAVCTSSAWDSKAVMSAWYVNSDQVSKTAPTGEYLTTGGFVIRGKKQFLPPAQLLLGFAIMFRISEESKARHVKHRSQFLDKPLLATPDLTDAETAAEPSVAGGDDEEDEDDEFPDAQPGPIIVDDEGDEITDAQERVDSEDDDFPDVHANGSTASGDEDEDRRRRQDINPLQRFAYASQVTEAERVEADGIGEEPRSEPDLREVDEQAGLEKEAEEQSYGETEPTEFPSINQSTRATSARERKEHRRAHAEATSRQKPGHPVRGKKGKAKKMAQKYANQDEEDREVAMKLLGSRAGVDCLDAEDLARRTTAETAEEARARRRAQHDKAQREGLEAEEIRRLNLEEGIEGLGEDESAHLTQLDDLVGTPLPGDEILEAIPVCAPWLALTKNKYKAKMQPGQQKKGKALREILGRWIKDAGDAKKLDQHSHDTERMWPREAELLKGLKEAEIVGVIPVKQVRLMMSGGGGGGDKTKGGGSVKGGKGGRGKGSKRVR